MVSVGMHVEADSRILSDSRVLSVRLARQAVPTALSFAVRRGVFDSALRDIRIQVSDLNPEESESAAEGLRESDGIAGLLELANDGDRRLLGLTTARQFRALVALPAARIRSVRDMRNRKIGLPTNRRYARVCALHVWTLALEASGLTDGSVEKVDIQHLSARAEDGASDAMLPGCPPEYATVIAALAAGKVDVVYVQGLRGIQAMRSCGAHAIFILSEHPDPTVRAHSLIPNVLTVDRHLADRSADRIAQVLACVRSNGVWAKSHEREVLRSVAEEFGAPEADIRAAFGREVHRHFVPELSEPLIAGLERLQRSLARLNCIAAEDLVRSAINPAPLAAAAKTAGH
jgi:ABC-type nitrate/sulfonate/bicarbonate transport system substrate-binding protein